MDLHTIKQVAESHYKMNDHPAMIIDLSTVRDNYLNFRAHFPQVDVHFAIKSLCDAQVIKILSSEGSSFEVASLNELQTLAKILSPTELNRVFYSNPVKSRRSIMIALVAGIRWFSVDSIEEIRKICIISESLKIHPSNLKLYLRLSATSRNSYWPLSKKFGVSTEKAREIFSRLTNLECKLSGFTFHVGSQCMDQEAWGNALLEVDSIINIATEMDVISYEVLVNLGGGFPTDVINHSVTLQGISDHLITCLEKCNNWERIRLAAEPGRNIVSSAGVLATRIILRTNRNGNEWLYIDCGVYHGMLEPSQGVMGNTFTTFESTETERFVLAGPTCDSADILPVTAVLPNTIQEDNLVFIMHSGAYSMAYGTGNAEQRHPGFNGFFPPSIYYLHK